MKLFLLRIGILCGLVIGRWLPRTKVSRKKMADDLDQMKGIVERVWSHIDDKREQLGIDVDDVYQKAHQELETATTFLDQFLVLLRFVANLQDGHTCISPSPWLLLQLTRVHDFRQIPELREVGEGLVVVAESPRPSPVRVGDILLGVNDQEASYWLNFSAELVNASGEAARRYGALQLMLLVVYSVNERPVLHFQRVDGTQYDFQPDVLSDWGTAEMISERHSRLGQRELRIIHDDLTYMKIPSFSLHADWWENDQYEFGMWESAITPERVVECWEKAIRWIDSGISKAEDSSGLIIDLRGNGGGNDPIAGYLAQRLIEGDIMYYRLQRRHSPEWKKLYASFPDQGWSKLHECWVREIETFELKPGMNLISRNPRKKVFQGQVVCLIDSGCSSATTVFLNCLRYYRPDIRFVGQTAVTTLGGGNEIGLLKHTKSRLGVSYCRGWGADGELLEGKVVEPDIHVRWTREEVCRGVDAELEAAVRCFKANEKMPILS